MASKVTKKYSSEFAKSGAKVGASINIRKPPRYAVTSGPQLQVQDATETYMPITLTNQDHVDISFSSADLTLNINEFSDTFLKPAMATLANTIDLALTSLYAKVPDIVGTAGQLDAGTATQANILAAIASARRRLSENACPQDGRMAVISPATEAGILPGLAALFNPASQISESYRKGSIGSVFGIDFSMDQNIKTHTTGTMTSGTVNAGAAVQAFGTIQTDASTFFSFTTASTSGTFTVGTPVTIANVFNVNPQSRQSTGVLKNFVVVEAVSGSATTVKLWPVPINSGKDQNCSCSTATIAAGASGALTSIPAVASDTRTQNLMFHKDAFALVTADLVIPDGVDRAAREVYDGISLRMVRDYDINTDQWPCRLDILYGVQAIYPELAVRLQG